MIKLLASDLDGTIVYNNEITTMDLEAVKKLKQTDIQFVVCTGKTYAMTKDICQQLEPTYGIFGNGTQIMNIQTGKEIIRNTITNAQVMGCLKIAEKHHLHIHIYTDHKIIAQENLNYMAYRNYILYKDGLRHIHPDSTQARTITMREAARLQTFSDDYVFFGTNSEIFKMIGNAVPPEFAKYCALAIYDLMKDWEDK